VRDLVHGDHSDPSEQEDEATEADLGCHDERRAVTPGYEVREHGRADGGQHADRRQARRREHGPTALAVQRGEPVARPGKRLHARMQEAAVPPLRCDRRRRRGLRTRHQAAIAELREQARKPCGSGGAETLLDIADQLHQRARGVEPLEQRAIGVGQPQEVRAVAVAEDPATTALGGVETLERGARPQTRADRRQSCHRRRDDERAARFGVAAPPLDTQRND
jgi:hypothetical protein